MRGTMLIVDDEPTIRKGLAKLVDSNELGWIVIGEASNGRDAIAKMADMLPKLVLTDIRMPLADGLEVARYASEHMPDTAVVILTGHRDFEYAQAAIRYGVREFLLKPCPEDTVCRVLREAYDQFRERVLRKEKEAQQLRVREEQLLRSMLLRLPHDLDLSRPIEQKLIGYEFWLLRIESYVPTDRGYRAQDMKLLQFAVGNIVQELLNSRTKGHRWFPLEYNEYAFFLEFHPDNAATMREIVDVLNNLLGLKGSMSRLGRLESSGQAELLYGAEMFGGEGGRSPGERNAGSWDNRFDEEKARTFRNEICSLLLLGRQAELQVYLSKMAEAIRSEPALEQQKMHALCASIAFDEVMRKELGQDDAAETRIGNQIGQLSRLHKPEQIDAWFGQQLTCFEHAFKSWLNDHSTGSIEQSIRYVEANYMNECSLMAAAAHVHLSPNYFGNLFKKATGESFNAYVAKYRLQKAKMLLANTEMKIAEIAEAVGYTDSNYFATAFKQGAGLSPTEFRKRRSSS
ncbi:response regulator [Paenibacillus sp. HJGM_3]|uniref:response regulator transcription factor n=1 Tax=Paenibacillus sp. HJGM_3 TaxID=3379816 RepID=UPI00385F506A